VLKYIKYGILAFLLLRIFLTGDLLDNTPFKAVFEFGGNPLNWIMTGVFIFLSLFVYRPFCRYFCPYGAIMALISKISFIKLRKDDYCISCRICERECQMDAMDKNAKTNAECILCGDCCTKCPKDSLSLSTNKKRR
jgi:polyferredoxin